MNWTDLLIMLILLNSKLKTSIIQNKMIFHCVATLEIIISVNLMPNLLVCFKLYAAGPHRLTTIDESASILSDISYDKTDDSLVSTPPVENSFTLR